MVGRKTTNKKMFQNERWKRISIIFLVCRVWCENRSSVARMPSSTDFNILKIEDFATGSYFERRSGQSNFQFIIHIILFLLSQFMANVS